MSSSSLWRRDLAARDSTSDNGGAFVRRQMKKDVVKEGWGASEKKISECGVTNRFGALFMLPIDVRVPLDRLDEVDLCR